MKQPALASVLALALGLPAWAAAPGAKPAAPPPAPATASAHAPQAAVSKASIVGYKGRVVLQKAGRAERTTVEALPAGLDPGDKILTFGGGSASLQFRDGTRMTLGEYAIFTIDEERDDSVTLNLSLGKVWLAVAKLKNRRFSVRTPAAVAAVRGTEFTVDVRESRTSVEVFGGLVAVRNSLGSEAMVGAAQRVSVLEGRMGGVERFEPKPDPRMPPSAAAAGAAGGEHTADGRREEPPAEEDGKGKDERRRRGPDDRPGEERKPAFGLNPDRLKEFITHQANEVVRQDAVQSAAAFESKTQLYQEGKTLIDAAGRRVRVEEYVKRPTGDSFRFISVSLRDGRTDSVVMDVQANTTLPENLAEAGNLWYSPTADMPRWWAIRQRLTMSNGVDSVVELGVDGKPERFTFAGGDPVFDPISNSVVSSPGFTHWRTMFGNRFEFHNGNGAAIEDVWNGRFASLSALSNGSTSLGGNVVSGMMWHTQPVKVNITDGATSRGEYWTDAFKAASAGGTGLAYARHTSVPEPGLAHFVTRRSYFSFTDTNNNGILDFGEGQEGVSAFYHDIVARRDGLTLTAAGLAPNTQATAGDTGVFVDVNGNGANDDGVAQTIIYPGTVRPMLQALDFASRNARDYLQIRELAIDDLGKILPAGGTIDGSVSLFTGRNFERQLIGSRLRGDIDVVVSPAFLFQSGASEISHQDRPIPSAGPKSF